MIWYYNLKIQDRDVIKLTQTIYGINKGENSPCENYQATFDFSDIEKEEEKTSDLDNSSSNDINVVKLGSNQKTPVSVLSPISISENNNVKVNFRMTEDEIFLIFDNLFIGNLNAMSFFTSSSPDLAFD